MIPRRVWLCFVVVSAFFWAVWILAFRSQGSVFW
jgi:hypothetical protein